MEKIALREDISSLALMAHEPVIAMAQEYSQVISALKKTDVVIKEQKVEIEAKDIRIKDLEELLKGKETT